MGLEGTDSAFEKVVAMDIWGHDLEGGAPVFCNGAAVFLADIVVKDLVVNGLSTLLEFGHDAVVRHNVVAVTSVLERLVKEDVAVSVICYHDVLVAAAGANRDATHIFSVDLADGLDVDTEFIGSDGWERTRYVVEMRSGWQTNFDVVMLFEIHGTDALADLSNVTLDGFIT